MRSPVERGSMPYSAVTQPLPELRIQPGTFSSRLAVQSTCVSPNFTRQEPSACFGDVAFEGNGAHFVELAFGGAHSGSFSVQGLSLAAFSRRPAA